MAINPDQNPLFRKVIQPWYDTDAACILTGIFMMLVFGFALAGISVASEIPGRSGDMWVPIALLVLSATGIAMILVRLYRRHAHRFKKDFP